MSNLAIRQALEVKLSQMLPVLATAWENKDFMPVAGQAYQEVYLLFAKPDNPTLGDDFYRQRGIMQVTLRYPLNTGNLAAGERAELIRETFQRGLSVAAKAVTTRVEETPEIGDGKAIDGRWVVIVRIRFYADIYRNTSPLPNQDAVWAVEEW